MYIIQYFKIWEVYVVYKKFCYKKEFFVEYGVEIVQYEVVKKVFDVLNGKVIFKVVQFLVEYVVLLEEKWEQYEQYKILWQDMIIY